VTILCSWRLQIVAGGLQLLGILLTALGVAVVWSWLERAADKAIETKDALDRRWALRRERLRNWWAHRRGRPAVMHRAAFDSFQVSDAATTSMVGRARVNRETVSDRQWLVHLDDRLYALHDLVDQAERRRSAELDLRLTAQQDELRAEIRRETRQGWELIVVGLFWSATGTGLGIFA